MKVYRIIKFDRHPGGAPVHTELANICCDRITSNGHHYEIRGNQNELVATLRITDKFVIEEAGGKK